MPCRLPVRSHIVAALVRLLHVYLALAWALPGRGTLTSTQAMVATVAGSDTGNLEKQLSTDAPSETKKSI